MYFSFLGRGLPTSTSLMGIGRAAMPHLGMGRGSPVAPYLLQAPQSPAASTTFSLPTPSPSPATGREQNLFKPASYVATEAFVGQSCLSHSPVKIGGGVRCFNIYPNDAVCQLFNTHCYISFHADNTRRTVLFITYI